MQKLANGRTLAAIAWISVFILAWLMAVEIVAMWPAGLFFVFFLIVAAVPTMLMWNDGQPERKKKDGQTR